MNILINHTELKSVMEKYQPRSIDDFVFPSQKSFETIKDIIDGRVIFPHAGKTGILLHGIWGTGKTSLARIIPYEMEKRITGREPGERFEAIKAGNKGADLMESIDRQTDLYPFSSFHYIILDEVDLLSDVAKSCLKSVMNKSDCIFIMTTNHLDKVDQGVINRSILIDFNAAPDEEWLIRITSILSDLNIDVPDKQLILDMIKPCRGSARDIIYAVQQLVAKYQRQAA